MQGVGPVFLMSRVVGRCLPASYEKIISLEGLNSMSIIIRVVNSESDQPDLDLAIIVYCLLFIDVELQNAHQDPCWHHKESQREGREV